jgi:hypothetical protein
MTSTACTTTWRLRCHDSATSATSCTSPLTRERCCLCSVSDLSSWARTIEEEFGFNRLEFWTQFGHCAGCCPRITDPASSQCRMLLGCAASNTMPELYSDDRFVSQPTIAPLGRYLTRNYAARITQERLQCINESRNNLSQRNTNSCSSLPGLDGLSKRLPSPRNPTSGCMLSI